MFLSIPRLRRWRRRREERRAVAERLRCFGDSFSAPEDVKRAGLERVLAEFERSKREAGR